MSDTFLRCTVCGRETTTSFGGSLRDGWPRCCGYTMRLERTDADVEAETTAVVEEQLQPIRDARDRLR